MFVCELLAEGPAVKAQKLYQVTMNICARYKLYGDDQIYRAEYKFDRVKCSEAQHREGKAPCRETWIHKDAQHKESYTPPI